MKTQVGLSAVAAFVALATPAAAIAPGVDVGSSQYAIGIVGFVPVVCHASVDASMVPVGGGSASLGSLKEFCNSPGGYRVVADYSASLANARLLVDGSPVMLDASGSSVVSQSAQAAIASHDLALEVPAGTTGGSLSFRIEPR